MMHHGASGVFGCVVQSPFVCEFVAWVGYSYIQVVLEVFCLAVCVLMGVGIVRVFCAVVSVMGGVVSTTDEKWSMCWLWLWTDITCQLFSTSYNLLFNYE
jgi:hypothetical protein